MRRAKLHLFLNVEMKLYPMATFVAIINVNNNIDCQGRRTADISMVSMSLFPQNSHVELLLPPSPW
jgi:hypothetical protein